LSVPEELVRERVATSELALVLPRNHSLSRRAAIALPELRDERFIMNEPDIGYGQFVQGLFADAGVLPNIVARADNVETIKLMIAAGIGIAILPRGAVDNEVTLKRLRALPLKPRREVPITLVRHPAALAPAAASCFELLQKSLRGAPVFAAS
jgi:DNA-binding transcriptional LysR family regulator